MASFEDELLRDAEDDVRTIEFIKAYLPSELKDAFSEDTLYYFLDALGEYYVELIEKAGDNEEIDIDVEAVAAHLVKQAKKDQIGDFNAEDVRWVVDAELEYAEQAEE